MTALHGARYTVVGANPANMVVSGSTLYGNFLGKRLSGNMTALHGAR